MSEGVLSRRSGRRRISGAAIALAVALVVNGCTVPAAQIPADPGASPSGASGVAGGSGANIIKIVSSLPRTGADKGNTDSIVNGYRMAFDEINNRIGDFTIQFLDWEGGTPARSGAWDASKEAENANAAVNDPDVMVYLGTYNSGAAKVSIPVLNRADMVMISPGNTYPGLTKPGTGEKGEPDTYYPNGKRNYARVVPADDLQGAVGAVYAKEAGVQRVYVLDDTELYGHGIAEIFAETARKLGLEVVGGPEGMDRSAQDYRALALKIAAQKPDMVYFGGVTSNNAGKLWSDLRAALGPDVLMMGPDGIFEQSFLDAAGQAAEGTLLTFGGVPPKQLTGAGADWYARYKEKYKQEPQVYAAYGYEAARVAIEAIKQVGKKDRAAIRDAVMATKDFSGVLGAWSFDANGDTNLTTMSISRVKGNKIAGVEFVGLRQAPK